jgi:hypothetical protein
MLEEEEEEEERIGDDCVGIVSAISSVDLFKLLVR